MSYSLQPGELLADRYRIQSILGKGGMGIVFSAIDEKTELPVAVKLLRKSAGTSTNIERFLREARVAARVESERIVRVLECGSLDAYQPYLVMERLEGVDLGCRIKSEKSLPLQDVADIVIQACEALAAAHAAGVIHRDIKPSNLFEHKPAGRPSTLKLLDFGISKCKSGGDNNVELTLTSSHDGGLLGSPPYMSPEQIRNPSRVDPRSDLWSLGTVAYRLLSGRYPFEGTSVGAVFASILERPIVPLRGLGIDVPPEVDAILARVLVRERDRRFRTAGELATAFAPFASAHIRPLAERARDISIRRPYVLEVDEPSTLTLSPRASEHPIEPVVMGTESLPQMRERRNFIAVGSAVVAAVSLMIFTAATDRASAASPTTEPPRAAAAAPPAPVVATAADAAAKPVASAPVATQQKASTHAPLPGQHRHAPPAASPKKPAPPVVATTPSSEASTPAPLRRDLQPNPYARP